MATSEPSIDKLFNSACSHVTYLAAENSISEEDLLYLYGRYKRVTEGECNTSKPGFLQYQARKKWYAWNETNGLSVDTAREQYVDKVRSLDPDWDPAQSKSGTLGLTVSRFAHLVEPAIEDGEKTIFDWVKENNLDRLKMEEKVEWCLTDDNGMSALHWASDRGHASMVEFLISKGVNVNLIDNTGQTPLHYASCCGHCDVIKCLLKNGADWSIQCEEGLTAKDCAEESVKDMFPN